MGIKVGESNKTFRYATNFDMSGSTTLTLKFTPPSGTSFDITTPRVTAPAVAVSDPDLGALTASTYMEFQTLSTDFLEAGNYVVCGTYESTATSPTSIFYGDDATFTVDAAC